MINDTFNSDRNARDKTECKQKLEKLQREYTKMIRANDEYIQGGLSAVTCFDEDWKCQMRLKLYKRPVYDKQPFRDYELQAMQRKIVAIKHSLTALIDLEASLPAHKVYINDTTLMDVTPRISETRKWFLKCVALRQVCLKALVEAFKSDNKRRCKCYT